MEHPFAGSKYAEKANHLATIILHEQMIGGGRVTISENKPLSRCYHHGCHRDLEEDAALITMQTPLGHERYGFHLSCLLSFLADYSAQN